MDYTDPRLPEWAQERKEESRLASRPAAIWKKPLELPSSRAKFRTALQQGEVDAAWPLSNEMAEKNLPMRCVHDGGTAFQTPGIDKGKLNAEKITKIGFKPLSARQTARLGHQTALNNLLTKCDQDG